VIKRLFEPEMMDKLVISVWDSGVGIAKEEQLKLFKMFGCL